MAQDKSSLAPAGDSIRFELTEENGFECIGAYDITVDELLSGQEGRWKKKLDIAISFITEYFKTVSEVSSNQIEEDAASQGIKRNTLLAAKKKLGIVADKRKQSDGKQYWIWSMPEKRV